MSVEFELPKIEEAINRLDALFAEVFSSNDLVMQDWVAVRFFLNAQNTSSNSDYAKCHKEELENIMCDIESAIYANEVTRKSILEKSLYSVKGYIETHFA